MSVLFTKVKGLAFSTTAMERAVRIFCVGGLVLGLAASSIAFAQFDIRNQSTKEELISAIQDWVGRELNVTPSQIEVMASDPRLIIKPCSSDPIFQFPLSTRKLFQLPADRLLAIEFEIEVSKDRSVWYFLAISLRVG